MARNLSTENPPALPADFLHWMGALLQAEYPAFLESFERIPLSGLRVNPIKLTAEKFLDISPYCLTGVPWCPTGFSVEPGVATPPGKHPYHAAGLYYLQDPSAMAAAELLNPREGDLVLDLCAAPGGKATHLAGLIRDHGLLVANEIHPQRVWSLAENLERWGTRNTAILNETPERLAIHFGGIFDRVLVDAPCSGEGLFRKNPAARSEWSLALVNGCTQRQQAILKAAARLVRPGGRLVYTTCTFNPVENEGTVSGFLREHRDFQIFQLETFPGFAPGRLEWLVPGASTDVNGAVRLWPHRVNGEGHFICAFERQQGVDNLNCGRSIINEPPIIIQRAFDAFCSQVGVAFPDSCRLELQGSYLYCLPPGMPEMEGLRAVHPGWWLGVWKKDRFEPAHAFAMALSSDHISRRIDLNSDQRGQIAAYLRGESLHLDKLEDHPEKDGWVLLAVDGYPLGWGKQVNGVVKNYYPRGLRWL